MAGTTYRLKIKAKKKKPTNIIPTIAPEGYVIADGNAIQFSHISLDSMPTYTIERGQGAQEVELSTLLAEAPRIDYHHIPMDDGTMLHVTVGYPIGPVCHVEGHGQLHYEATNALEAAGVNIHTPLEEIDRIVRQAHEERA